MLQFEQSGSSPLLYNPNAVFSPSSQGPSDPATERKRSENLPKHKKPGNRVLMMGRVRELALYRAEVLQHSGFLVSVPTDLDEALQIMQSGNFDAIVLSYTLPNEIVEYLVERARESCPNCPIIAITHSSIADRRIQPNAIALANEGPKALIAALKSVLEVKS